MLETMNIKIMQHTPKTCSDFLNKTQGMELFPKDGTGVLATIGPALIAVYLLADIGSIAGGCGLNGLGGCREEPSTDGACGSVCGRPSACWRLSLPSCSE